MNEIDVHISNNPHSVETQNTRQQIAMEIELLENYKVRAAQVRSRIKWVEEGEKNTKFFLSLEKSRANSKIMEGLVDENGKLVTQQQEILKVQTKYFSDLYKQKIKPDGIEDRISEFTTNNTIPQMSDDQKNSCEGEITEEELLCALKRLKNGSSPGSDGITVEFLKMFWQHLKKLLTLSINHSFNLGTLSSTQRRAVITLIHKGRDLPRRILKKLEANIVNK